VLELKVVVILQKKDKEKELDDGDDDKDNHREKIKILDPPSGKMSVHNDHVGDDAIAVMEMRDRSGSA